MPDRPTRPRSTRVVVDVGMAVGLALLGGIAATDPPGPAFDRPTVTLWAVPALAAAATLQRRRAPAASWWATTLLTIAATVSGFVGPGTMWIAYLPPALTLYTVNTRFAWRASVPATIGTVSLSLAAQWWCYTHLVPSLPVKAAESEILVAFPVDGGLTAITLLAAGAVGLATAAHRRTRDQLTAQATRQAVVDERLRIARELHDVIGHSLTVIAVKATVANHLATTRPEQVSEALNIIERTSQETLSQVRQVLGLWRGREPEENLGPIPTVAQLPELVAQHDSPERIVRLTLHGADDLAEPLGLTVYRIVQEALTNVAKHSRARECDVIVAGEDDEVRVSVTDTGPARRRAQYGPPGHGLVGMRERVEMYGGTLRASPRGDGFEVSARIPRAGRDSS